MSQVCDLYKCPWPFSNGITPPNPQLSFLAAEFSIYFIEALTPVDTLVFPSLGDRRLKWAGVGIIPSPTEEKALTKLFFSWS